MLAQHNSTQFAGGAHVFPTCGIPAGADFVDLRAF
jgi:hypothetical protein